MSKEITRINLEEYTDLSKVLISILEQLRNNNEKVIYFKIETPNSTKEMGYKQGKDRDE